MKAIKDRESKEKLMAALRKDMKVCQDVFEISPDLNTFTPTVYLSQLDMAMVLYTTYAFPFMFHDYCGVSDLRGMNGFIHFWALIGRLSGIQDRFNPALYPDRDMHFKIFQNLVIPSIKDININVIDVSCNYVKALEKIGVPVSVNALFYGVLSKIIPGFKGENLYQHLNWLEVAQVGLLYAIIWSIKNVPFGRQCVNLFIKMLTEASRRKTGR